MKSIYVTALLNALKKFYHDDKCHLSDVDERTMVGCIYRYIWKDLPKCGNRKRDVDVEYSRMHRAGGIHEGKTMMLNGDVCSRCQNSGICYDILMAKSKMNKNGERVYVFRPDIIIHNRQAGEGIGSELIVEVKKCKAKRAGKLFDIAKLMHCICDPGLRYAEGAFVELHEAFAKVHLYHLNSPCVAYEVSAHAICEKRSVE